METFKAYLLIVGFIGAIGFGGYWAATSLEDPVRITDSEEIRIVAQTPVASVVGEDTVVESVDTQVLGEETSDENQNSNAGAQTTPSTQYASLISQLEKLIADTVLMKEGSRGTRVGTVQEFLNVYNGTSNKVDNDYGPGTKTKVANFQKAVGLTADGQAGPNTYQKMIDWLESN